MKNEIILYQQDETVEHINNCFKEGELEKLATVKDSLTVQKEGQRKVSRKISLQLKTQDLPTQGVFFEGQIFDAYELATKIIRSAKKEIILLDNYIDENTITHLCKKRENVKVLIFTKALGKQLALDIKKANEQYKHFEAREFTSSHDRFLIIDQKELYHLGASLKDLGKKWFAFSRMDSLCKQVLEQLKIVKP